MLEITLKISVPTQNVTDRSFANMFQMSADTCKRHFVFVIYFSTVKKNANSETLGNLFTGNVEFRLVKRRVAPSEQLTQFLVIFENCDEIF